MKNTVEFSINLADRFADDALEFRANGDHGKAARGFDCAMRVYDTLARDKGDEKAAKRFKRRADLLALQVTQSRMMAVSRDQSQMWVNLTV